MPTDILPRLALSTNIVRLTKKPSSDLLPPFLPAEVV
jgi:hypothetical protein